MRKNLKVNSTLFPLPVLIIGTYNKDGTPNAMNAAWGGIHDSDQLHLCLSSDHKTSENIRERRVFSVSFATKKTVVESDYFGIVSGKKVNKIEKANFHFNKCEFIDAPYFEEYPVYIECKINKLEDDGTTMYIVADIINMNADENVLNEKGKIDINKLEPIIYNAAEHTYNVVGEKVGNAFSSGTKIK